MKTNKSERYTKGHWLCWIACDRGYLISISDIDDSQCTEREILEETCDRKAKKKKSEPHQKISSERYQIEQ